MKNLLYTIYYTLLDISKGFYSNTYSNTVDSKLL